MKPQEVVISENEVTENAQGGIVLRCRLSGMFNVSDNYVADNYGAGIYVGGPSNILEGNVVTSSKSPLIPHGDEAADNPNGIRVSREADNTILKSNDVGGNDAADIFIKEDLLECLMEENAFESYEGLEEVSGKKVKTGNPEIPSGSSVSIAELIGLILAGVAVIIVGYGFSRRRKSAK
jgi:parallel beta-helix repeat protein